MLASMVHVPLPSPIGSRSVKAPAAAAAAARPTGPPPGFVWRPNFSPPPGTTPVTSYTHPAPSSAPFRLADANHVPKEAPVDATRTHPETTALSAKVTRPVAPVKSGDKVDHPTFYHGHFIAAGEKDRLPAHDDLASLQKQVGNANRRFPHAQRHRPLAPRSPSDQPTNVTQLPSVDVDEKSTQLPDLEHEPSFDPYLDPAILDHGHDACPPSRRASDAASELSDTFDDFIDVIRRIWVLKTGRSVTELDDEIEDDEDEQDDVEGDGDVNDFPTDVVEASEANSDSGDVHEQDDDDVDASDAELEELLGVVKTERSDSDGVFGDDMTAAAETDHAYDGDVSDEHETQSVGPDEGPASVFYKGQVPHYADVQQDTNLSLSLSRAHEHTPPLDDDVSDLDTPPLGGWTPPLPQHPGEQTWSLPLRDLLKSSVIHDERAGQSEPMIGLGLW